MLGMPSINRLQLTARRGTGTFDDEGPPLIEDHSALTRSRKPRSWRRLLVLAAIGWCALIAWTSSTVILPHDFFAWLASHVFKTDAGFRRFVAFWSYGWFAIVKGWHAAEFAILFTIAYALLNRFERWSSRRNIALASMLCLLYAVSDEYHQTFVPGRGGTWRDVAIDSLGIGLAGSIAWLRGGSPDPAAFHESNIIPGGPVR